MAQDQSSQTVQRNAGGGRPGRRPGHPDTRDTIIEAAHRAFTSDGYRRTTAKSIADEAGVDPAMINYFFGSRQGLFREVLFRHHGPAAREQAMAENLGPDNEEAHSGIDFAERLIRQILGAWDRPDTRELLTGMILSAGQDAQSDELILAIGASTAAMITKHLQETGLSGEEAKRRSALVVSLNAGLVYGRYIIKAEHIAQMTTDQIVELHAPAIRAVMQP